MVLFRSLKLGASGWDEIDSRVIKSSFNPILAPFLHICNLSVTTGVFPIQFKVAREVPNYKGDDLCIFTNYRPVSVLPLFSKSWPDRCAMEGNL